MVNRFYRRTPYDIGLYVPPVDVIRETLAHAQKQYDTNYMLASQVKNNFINSLPQDRQAANEIQKRWEGQIDTLVQDAGEDYSKIGRQLGKLMTDMRREYNPGGKAHAITSNFGNYTKWIAEHQERVAKGDVLGEDLNLANSYFMKNYQGIGEIDPVTGAYNHFNPETLTDYQDPNKIIQDTFKEFKPEKHKVGTAWIASDGTIRHQEVESEGITAQRLNPSFQTALTADPKFASYLKQRVKFSGQDPAASSAFINAYAAQRANDLSYMNESNVMKLDRDPLAVARAKAAMDKENIDYMMSFQQHGETTNGLLSQEPTFDPDNWRNGFNINPGKTGLDKFGNPMLRPWEPDITDKKESLQDFLSGKNDEKIQAKWSTSPELLRTHWANKVGWAPEFKAKYGKDPKWTAEFERNFMYDIKKIAPSHSMHQIVELEIPEPARDQNLLRALRGGISGGWSTTQLGSNISNAGIPKEILDYVYDEKEQKFKNLDLIQVTYVQPGPGVKAAGYKLSTPKGVVIIEDQNASRKAYSNQMAAGFNPIFFNGQKMGGAFLPYDIKKTPDGRVVEYQGIPFREFELNADALRTGQVKYDENIYMVDEGSTVNNPIYIYEQGPQGPTKVKRTAAQIGNLMVPAFGGSLGYGASKSDVTPFPYFSKS